MVFDGGNIKTYAVNIKNRTKSKLTQPLYSHTYIHTISSARHCKRRNENGRNQTDQIDQCSRRERRTEKHQIGHSFLRCIFCGLLFRSICSFIGDYRITEFVIMNELKCPKCEKKCVKRGFQVFATPPHKRQKYTCSSCGYSFCEEPITENVNEPQ